MKDIADILLSHDANPLVLLGRRLQLLKSFLCLRFKAEHIHELLRTLQNCKTVNGNSPAQICS